MRDSSQTILVTGAGSGFGEALVKRFASAGFAVGVTDIDAGRAASVLEEIVQQGGSGFAAALDVTRQSGWDEVYQQVMEQWGGVGILVNNAGVAAAGRLEDTPLEHWQWVLDTDLVSVIRGCHRFIPLLRKQGRGHIVNVASFAGMTPVPEVSAYATAKAGVVALSEQLRVDLAGSGVDVTLVCPAYVQTRLLETFRSHDERHRKMAERWMAKSSVTADAVAEQIFKAVRKKKFLVLTHSETRWLWRFRRWFPERYFRMMIKVAEKLKSRSRA